MSRKTKAVRRPGWQEAARAAFSETGRRLPRAFFVRPGQDEFYAERAIKVAEDLLGKFLVRKIGKKILVGEIVEVEVYAGTKDRAAHTFGGRVTERNKIMYGKGGIAYVYFIYGMHWQMNVIVGKSEPHCVLLRALDLGDGGRTASGPGKLCKYMKLDKSFHGEDLTVSPRLWLEDRGIGVNPGQIIRTKRVGIGYAGSYWGAKRWRFYIKGNGAVSKK